MCVGLEIHVCFLLLTEISFLLLSFDADQLGRKKKQDSAGLWIVGCSLNDKMLD